MHSELDYPENPEMIAGTEFEHVETGNLAGGEAYLSEAVSRKSDIDRRFLIKHFYENGATTEELYESETLAQNAADNHHQAVLASILFDRKLRTSVMLKAAKDTNTIQDLLVQWEDSPPEDQETEYYDMGRLKESIAIIKSLLGALDGIHNDIKKPTLHMDLSPSNIMWGKNIAHGTAYLIDFSCCVKVGHKVNDSRRTTLSFAAPETSIPGKILTPAADIYSVGAVFLLLVAGMAAASNEKGEKKWSVRQLPGAGNCNVTDPIDTLEIPDAYKGKLSEVIIKATAPIKKRYQTAAEMLKDIAELEKIISGRGMTPETLFRGSEILFERACRSDGQFNYIPDKDLLTLAVDCNTKEEVDLLTKNIILLGGGGSGKTTWVYVLWKQCLEEWKRDPKKSPIPIFVPLNTFDSKKSNWDFFIRDYIAETYFKDLSKDDDKRRADLWGLLSAKSSYNLFLDGINEAVDSSMLVEEINQLAALERVNILLTSRNDLGEGWKHIKTLFSVAELIPLSDDLIIKKLHNKELGSPSQRLLETLRRPMFLAMFLGLKITDRQVETPGQIMYEYHNYLMEAFKTGHHSDEQELFKLVIQQILPKVASGINSMMCDSEQIYEVIEGIHFKSAKFRSMVDSFGTNRLTINATSIFQNCGILRKMNEDLEGIEYFLFAHQNYLEFYQALDVYNQMTTFKKGRELPESLTAGILPDAVTRFLGDLLGEHEFRTKTDCCGEPSPVEEWIQNNCAGRTDRETQVTIRNLIEVMKWSRDRCITANYSNIDLSLADFYDCRLPNSSFEYATVADSTFIRFGHSKPVDTLSLVHSPERLVTGCWGERGICFWDRTTGQVVKRIDHYDTISTFEISDDEQLVMVRCLGKATVYRIADGEKVNDLNLYSLNASMAQKDRRELVEFCRDNRTILCSCGPEGEEEVRLWDVYTGKSKPVIDLNKGYLKKPEARTQCCALSADRSTLYAVSECGELAVWDLKHHKHLKTFQVDNKVESLIITPDKKYAALLTDEKVLRVLCVATGVIETVCDSMETDVITATNTHLIWVGNRKLCGYAFESKETLAFNTPQITALFADSKGERLFFADAYGRIRIGDIREKRIIASFECGTYVPWSEPHSVIPHIYDNGVARIMCDRQIQCIQKERSYVIRSRNYCNYFDDNYHICLEVDSEESDRLVVRDLRTGAVISSVADDLRCVAYDAGGGELFDTRSDFRWAKYCAAEQKLVVNYWAGFVKIWDLRTGKWTAAGDWSYEVSHILNHCDEDDWDAMREELIDISDHCFLAGAYIVFGTCDGRIQFWNFEGSKVADVLAHNSGIERMYTVPGGIYFISEGVDGSRCIWNVKTFEKTCYDAKGSLINQGNIFKVLTVDEARHAGFDPDKSFEDSCDTDKDLIVHSEVVEDLMLFACEEKDKLPSNRIISESGDMVVYYVKPNPENPRNSYNSFIRVYNTRTKKRSRSYDLFLAKFEALDDNFIEFSNYAVNLSLCEKEQQLAAAFADGSIILYNLSQDSLWPSYYWDVIDAENISNCIFTDVELSSMLEKRLWQNGAVIY